jgi:hypothetical protein
VERLPLLLFVLVALMLPVWMAVLMIPPEIIVGSGTLFHGSYLVMKPSELCDVRLPSQ